MKLLFTKILNLAKRIYTRLRQILQIKWVRLVLQAVLILASIIFLASSFKQYGSSLQNLHVDTRKVIFSFLLITLNLFIGAVIWWLLLRSFHQKVNIIDSTRVQLFSNIAKYLPGYGWQIAGKSYLTYQMGIPGGVIFQGMTIEFILLIMVGVAFAFLIVPIEFLMRWPLTRQDPHTAKVIGFWLSAILMLGLIGIPSILKIIKKEILISKVRFDLYASAVLAIFGSWWLLSYAFWQLGAAFLPIPITDYAAFAFALTVSILVGLAILILPSGIGVRESLMVLLLQPILSAPLAVLVASTFRLLTIFSDFLSALGIALFYRFTKHPIQNAPQDNKSETSQQNL